MNPIELPRAIQELSMLSDEVIQQKLESDQNLVHIFQGLNLQQVSHMERSLASRFITILDHSKLDEGIRTKLVTVLKGVGGFGIDLEDRAISWIVYNLSMGTLAENWGYLTESNKKKILIKLIQSRMFEEMGDLFKRIKKGTIDIDFRSFSVNGVPFIHYFYEEILKYKDLRIQYFALGLDALAFFVQHGAPTDVMNARGETLLHVVVEKGDLEGLQKLINAGADPNVKDAAGTLLIFLAYKYTVLDNLLLLEISDPYHQEDYQALFPILLASPKIDLNGRDQAGKTLFHAAQERKDEAVLRRILADPKIPEEDINAYRLHMALVEQNKDLIDSLLKKENINYLMPDFNGIPVFHLLCYQVAFKKRVLNLISKKKELVNRRDFFERTPLYYACIGDNVEVAEALLACGARTDIQSKFGAPPIIDAYDDKSGEEVFLRLLKHKEVDPNDVDGQENTLLHLAAKAGDVVLIEALLQHRFLNPYRRNRDRQTPVSVAVQAKNKQALLILLKDGRISPYEIDREGNQVLKITGICFDQEVFYAILEHPLVSQADKNGLHLLWALMYEDWDAAMRYAKQSQVNPNFITPSGGSVLIKAFEKKKYELVKELLSKANIDPNVFDQNGESFFSILFQQVESRRVGADPLIMDIFMLLLENRALNPNQVNRRGTSFLLKAFYFLPFAFEKLANNPNANLNIKTEDGRPFSFHMYEKGEIALLKKLLEEDKIDVNAQDGEGCTLLHRACEKLDQDMVSFLLKHKKLNINHKMKGGKTYFDYFILCDDLISNAKKYYQDNATLITPLLLACEKLSMAQRNGYRLFLFLLNEEIEEAQKVLHESEVDVVEPDCLDLSIVSENINLIREIIQRGAVPTIWQVREACDYNNLELAELLFDACIDLKADKIEVKDRVFKVLFPAWNWDAIYGDLEENLDEIFANPEDVFRFTTEGTENPSLFELILIFSEASVFSEIIQTMTEEERELALRPIREKFPTKSLFFDCETTFAVPVKAARDLPDAGDFSYENAIAIFRKGMKEINFTDPTKKDYVPREHVKDQGKICMSEELMEYGENLCKYMIDPAHSLYSAERTSSRSYEKMRKKFLYLMLHIAKEKERLRTDRSLSEEERIRIKRELDQELMLVAASGNHCMLAKNDVLEEELDKAYGVTYLPTLANKIAHMVQRYRLGILESIFTVPNSHPPEIDTHGMQALMIHYRDDIGVPVEDLVEDDPLMATVAIDYLAYAEYMLLNTPIKIAEFIRKELRGPGAEVSLAELSVWLTENPTEGWDFYDELISDIEKRPGTSAYAFLYRNYSVDPSPIELLESVPGDQKAVHLQRLKEIEGAVARDFSRMKIEKEAAIKEKRAIVEKLSGQKKQQVQLEINKIFLELGQLPGRRLNEQRKKKLEYLHEQRIGLTPKQYLMALKEKDGDEAIRRQIEGKSLDDQWEILEKHGIIKDDPLQALQESSKDGEELSLIYKELADKDETEQWQVLARHGIRNPNPATPEEALEKRRRITYSNQSFIEGFLRMDRVIALLEYTNQIKRISIES